MQQLYSTTRILPLQLKRLSLLLSIVCLQLVVQSKNVVVSEIFFDTPMNESLGYSSHHNGEYFELTNTTGSPVIVGDWKLTNRRGSYTIPYRTVLGAYESLIVVYKNDPSFDIGNLFLDPNFSEREVFYQDKMYWRNSGDDFLLMDNYGNIVDSGSYRTNASAFEERMKSAVNGDANIDRCFSLHRTQESIILENGTFRSGVPTPFIYTVGNEQYVGDLSKKIPPLKQVPNRNAEIKTIPISTSVSTTGGAMVDLPLTFPGATPQLALRYNSQSDVGSFGYGTELVGLSSIMIAPKTLYQDGEKMAPSYSSDIYALDGTRLYPVDGDVNLFQTETYSELRIEKYNGGFKVTSPIGAVSEYGTTSDSRMVNSKGIVVGYRMTKSSDALGNYVTYHYTYGGIYLDHIEYGGCATSPSIGIISFSYTSNSYLPRKSVVSGGVITLDKIITSISVAYDGVSFMKYRFEYDDIRLSQVKEYTPDGNERSTELQWGDNFQPYTQGLFKPGEIRNMRIVASGDFDGD